MENVHQLKAGNVIPPIFPIFPNGITIHLGFQALNVRIILFLLLLKTIHN